MHILSARGFSLAAAACILAAGCSAAAAAQPQDSGASPLECVESSLHPGRLETTSRGYAYSYVVYLPPCYEAGRAYPVLYLIPGRGGGPESWFGAGTTGAADELIRQHVVPPFIIVGTENTDSDRFGDTIVSDLLPFVEANFSVQAERDGRAVAGGSLGGVAAYRLALRHPDLFASAALFGSGLVPGEEAALENWLAAPPAGQRPRLFLNSGEQDPYMLDQARALMQILDKAGVDSTLLTGEGGHDYGYWISNFPSYFAWLAEDWSIPE